VSLVVAWAFFEAIVWPVIPEVLLVVLVLAAPARWWHLTLAAVLAGVVGGTVMLGIAAAGLHPLQPLVTDEMRAAAASDVTERRARAVYEQPFSGIPYKVYATAAGEARIEPVSFAVHSSIARGSRFALVAGVAALLSVALRRWRRYYLATLLALGIGFTIGLLRVVAGWSS
jgi:membrane protein YqaA with SNARE-associated domain